MNTIENQMEIKVDIEMKNVTNMKAFQAFFVDKKKELPEMRMHLFMDFSFRLI